MEENTNRSHRLTESDVLGVHSQADEPFELNDGRHKSVGSLIGDKSVEQSSASEPEELNTTTTNLPVPLPPPPNGGRVAWIQCADTFCLWFAAWGLVNSFGVFQAYYETALPRSSSSRISWIGSLELSIFIAGTSIIGPIYDVGYLRTLLAVGTFLTVFGIMMTSLGVTYWQVILAQGICMGLGMTCLFVPCVAVLPPYFSSRRALAMGLAASGSSIGAIIFTIIFQQLLPKVGFGWATRTIGFVLLASLVLPLVTMRKRIPRSTRRALIDSAALREPAFDLVLGSMFLVFAGLYVPYFYIEVFSVRTNIMTYEDLSLNKYLIVIMNTGSAFGRLLPNILADKVGPWNTIIAASIISSVIGFAWIAVTTKAGIIAFCVLYGFFSGSFVALTPVIWAILSPNPSVLGTRIGMMSVPTAAGLLIGSPIAGALVNGTSFIGLQVFCGCMVAGGGLFLSMGRLAKAKSGAPLKL